jgi:hypothetical protein
MTLFASSNTMPIITTVPSSSINGTMQLSDRYGLANYGQDELANLWCVLTIYWQGEYLLELVPVLDLGSDVSAHGNSPFSLPPHLILER